MIPDRYNLPDVRRRFFSFFFSFSFSFVRSLFTHIAR